MARHTATFKHNGLPGIYLTIHVESSEVDDGQGGVVLGQLASKRSDALRTISGDDWPDTWTLDSWGLSDS
jgi:hypothetical protein